VIPVTIRSSEWNTEINATKTSRVPTLNDRFWAPGGNPELMPEIGFEVENNNRIYLLSNLLLSASVFYGQTSNWIIWLPMTNGLWSPKNVKEVERYGIESKAELYFSVKSVQIGLDFQYNYLKATTINSYSLNDASLNKQLMYVPNHQTQFNIDLAFKKIRIFYSQSCVGSVYIDSENNSYLPYYLPADLGVDWTSKFIAGKQIVVGLKIINLFNEDYHIIANRPMPGMHFLLNLKINLKK
jgi:iron complex outermembrane receptor protein